MGTLDTGGAEMMVVTAAEALRDKCAMDFLVFGSHIGTLESRASRTGGRILRLASPRESGPVKFVRELKNLLLEGRYQAVHSHVNLASGLVMKAAHAAGVPVRIAHSHTIANSVDSVPRRGYRWLAKRLISRHSTVFAACGEEAGRNLFGARWHRGPGVVLPNGVNIDNFLDVRRHRMSVRAELELSANQRAIGMIARLAEVKNHDFMLEVLALDKSQSGSLVLLIIGDGPLRSRLEDRVAELGLFNRVRFLGLRDDVPYLLGGLDLLAMPSLYEGLPVSLAEAQAAAVPALVSDRVTKESDFGLGLISWLPLGDPAEWLHHLYTDTPRPSSSVVEAKFADLGYDIRTSASKLLAIYASPREQK